MVKAVNAGFEAHHGRFGSPEVATIGPSTSRLVSAGAWGYLSVERRDGWLMFEGRIDSRQNVRRSVPAPSPAAA
jgi:hypothetical protein